jgi:uncharacterized protein YfbU (UPF0304 family)
MNLYNLQVTFLGYDVSMEFSITTIISFVVKAKTAKQALRLGRHRAMSKFRMGHQLLSVTATELKIDQIQDQ